MASILVVSSGVWLLFNERTEINCEFRINCDSATVREMSRNTSCFWGPQLVHWGDNLAQVPEESRLTISYLTWQAHPETCMPSTQLLDSQLVPEEFRHDRAIHNILPHSFGYLFVSMVLLYAAAMLFILRKCPVHQYIDEFEQKAEAQHFDNRAAQHWLSLQRCSLLLGPEVADEAPAPRSLLSIPSSASSGGSRGRAERAPSACVELEMVESPAPAQAGTLPPQLPVPSP